MSIIKSNNASVVNDPINRDWLKESGIYQRISVNPVHIFHTYTKDDDLTIWDAFLMYIVHKYGNNDMIISSQWTKINKIVFQPREMRTKGEILKFLYDVGKVLGNEHLKD